MVVSDRCYGDIEITDKELIAVYSLPELERLTGVGQHGWTDVIHPEIAVNRFDHTIGTGLLTRLLGGSIEEQAAAFIHDISHTAFSHFSDLLYESEESGSFHEKELPAFLETHKLNLSTGLSGCPWTYSQLTDDSRYSILEQPAPALCADRLDYLFRDSIALGLIDTNDVSLLVNELFVEYGRIFCRDIETAVELVEVYDEADRLLWRKPEYLGYNAYGASIVKDCIRNGILHLKDLWSTDEQLIAKIFESHDEDISKQLRKLLNGPAFIRDESVFNIIIKSRSRYIDPEIIFKGESVSASSLCGKCKKIKEASESYGAIYIPMRII